MSRIVKPSRTLRSELKRLDEQQRRTNSNSAFQDTGFHPTATNGIESDNFDGDLNAGDPGTTGWSMDADQAAFGELILRPGSIGNDSLTNPLRPVRLHSDAADFPVTTSWTYPATVNVSVPEGFSQLLIVNLVAGASAHNTTATEDVLWSAGTVAGYSLGGYAIGSAPVAPSDKGVAHNANTGLLTGLTPGATLTFRAGVITSFGDWSTLSTNVAQVDMAGLWLR